MSGTDNAVRLKVDWISAMCLILLRNLKQGKRCSHDEIAEEFKHLKDSGMRFRDLGLRPAPGGFMSEDVLVKLWQWHSLGFYHGNPHAERLILTDGGRRFCEEVVGEELAANPEEFRSVAKALQAECFLAGL